MKNSPRKSSVESIKFTSHTNPMNVYKDRSFATSGLLPQGENSMLQQISDKQHSSPNVRDENDDHSNNHGSTVSK